MLGHHLRLDEPTVLVASGRAAPERLASLVSQVIQRAAGTSCSSSGGSRAGPPPPPPPPRYRSAVPATSEASQRARCGRVYR